MEAKPVVLIVEDDLLVRMLAVEIAEEPGLAPWKRLTPTTRFAPQKRPDIRVVFTDIDMPGSMDGLELAVAIRHRWPPIQIVLTSGKMRPAADELPENSHFVPKPYDFARLTGLLQSSVE